jgi:ribosomal protein S18 acetylase RimI-like enzyme
MEIEETKEKIPLELLLLADPSEEMINEYIGNAITIAAKEKGGIVGVLVLIKTRPMTMEIINISVLEEYQNKGIGRKLIMAGIEYARREKYKIIEIGTGNPGVVQMLLYQKCGFRIVGVELNYFRKNYKEIIIENGIECRDMIRMRLEFKES